MRKFVLVSLLALAGCGGSGYIGTDDEEVVDAGDGGDAEGGFQFAGGNQLPPGTDEPSVDSSVTRFEPNEAQGGNLGDGFAQDFTYDAATDTFVVDNLAFDGANGYTRDTVVPTIGGAAVYRADAVFVDTFPDPDAPINQFDHRLIFKSAPDGSTRVAIVRTGAYVGYGFGGFIYERDSGAVIPTTGQASYQGDYSGIRDFNGRGGLELVNGDITMAIDFEDFNDGDAVTGLVTNRRVFDLNGNDITQSLITAINTEAGSNLSALPNIRWVVGPGNLDPNGEMVGQVFSTLTVTDAATGNTQVIDFEDGIYYGLLSGDNVETLTGVIELESVDYFNPDGTVRETAGYILNRE